MAGLLLATEPRALSVLPADAAAQMAADAQQQQQEEAAASCEGAASATPAQLLLPEPAVRQYLEALTEQLLATHTSEVLQRAQAAAEERIRCSAVQAMAALTAPELGPAAIGTAAAVVAEVAAAAAEQRLRTYVPSALRRAATEHLQHLLAAAAKGGKGPRHAPSPATSLGAAAGEHTPGVAAAAAADNAAT